MLSLNDIRVEAADFLDRYHSESTIPVPIEEIVEFDFELELVPVPGIKDELAVDAFLTSDLKSIYIDEFVLQHVPVRYRFSLAHELAHYWLHQDLYLGTSIRSVADYRRVQEAIGAEEYRWLEWQANTFAGLVLVPEPALKDEFDRTVKVAYDAGLSRKQVESFPARQRIAQVIAGKFGVSEQVAAIRLEKDGHLPPLLQGQQD